MTDFALARKVLRDIAKNFSQPGASVGIQAALGLIKLVQLRKEIPSDILNETPVNNLKLEREKLKDLSPEELQQRYKAIINRTYNT